MKQITSVSLRRETRERLVSFGKKNQSYDNLLNEILNYLDTADQWWAERR